MTPEALLAHLRASGVELWVEGEDRLRYRAPKGRLPEEHRQRLVNCKKDILTLIRGDGGNGVPVADTPRKDARLHPYREYVNPILASLLARLDLDKTFVRGEGCRLYDGHGAEYLDFTAQFGALPFGFNPPEIWAAITSVRDAQLPSFVQPSLPDPAGELAKRLVEIAPRGMRYVAFCNSGAEAVEVAMKLCRAATGRRRIIATRNAFHGKTLGALSATGRAYYQEPFGAPVPGFSHVEFGNVRALEEALGLEGDPPAAFIVEPIQGEGGIVEAPPGYLRAAQDLCAKYGVPLILDEVQTGLGRTGAMFACDQEKVVPDVLTLAKALGGGLMPIGACVYRERLMTTEFALRHSSTFAGNALACRAGLATIDLLTRDENLIIRRVTENGAYLKNRLLSLQAKYPRLVKSVRGRGYMLGVQIALNADVLNQGIFAYLAEQDLLGQLLCSYLLNVEKVRIAPTMNAGEVLRIEPPLTADRSDCDCLVDALDRVFGLLQNGNTAGLVGHLVGRTVVAPPAVTDNSVGRFQPVVQAPPADESYGRFAFLIHMMDVTDCYRVDASLRSFNSHEITEFLNRLDGLLEPLPVGWLTVTSPNGSKAYGELILVPRTAADLLRLSQSDATAEVRKAVRVAKERGARIVGLGGFTSIVTRSGLSLKEQDSPALTTGNSYTVSVASRAIQMACDRVGRPLAGRTVALLGAAGAVGRALARRLAPNCAKLILVGRPDATGRSEANLQKVAAHILQCVGDSANSKRQSGAISLAVTTDLALALQEADVVVTATNAPATLIDPDQLLPGAVVYEISRPFNVSESVRRSRPDVTVVEGGVVALPGHSNPHIDLGLEQGQVFACLAETALLALEKRYRDASLGTELDHRFVDELEVLGDRHEFKVIA